MTKTKSPSPRSIVALRKRIQKKTGAGITAGQDTCADLLHTSRRTWQQWETGARKMHPAFWELVRLKESD